MNESNKLSADELAALKQQQDKREPFYQHAGPVFRESFDALDLLFAHIAATDAQRESEAEERARFIKANADLALLIAEKDARIMEMESALINQAALLPDAEALILDQQKRIKELETALRGVIDDCTLKTVYVGDFYRDAVGRAKARARWALTESDTEETST